MDITVIGTGYVGLVTGVCLAEMGNRVTCVDKDEAKVGSLKRSEPPIYEPGLKALLETNLREGRIAFTASLSGAMASSSVYLIAVGTPPGEDGSADLRHVLEVAREIGRNLNGYCVIVDKSTVPVGTAEKVRAAVSEELGLRGVEADFDVVSNPEFLKEGAAVEDFLKPDRIIIGCDSERAKKTMHEIYAPFTRSHERIIYMPVRAAEMTKYAANAMLATKISFMNEIALLCERMEVDVEHVRAGIGSDTRIGFSFIYPGCGYGGSCFPKDVRALVHTAVQNGVDPLVLHAVQQRNEAQKRVLFEKIKGRFGPGLKGASFALWGLSFKPGTDDIREATSRTLIESLIGEGAAVRAFDPAAMASARREMPSAWFDGGSLVLVEHQYDALRGADALVLVTEWKSFRHPDFALMKGLLRKPVIFDGRNQYDPEALRGLGFEYFGIGR